MPYPFNFSHPGSVDIFAILIAISADAANLLTVGSETRSSNPVLYSNMMFPTETEINAHDFVSKGSTEPNIGYRAGKKIVIDRSFFKPTYTDNISEFVEKYRVAFRINSLLANVPFSNEFNPSIKKIAYLFHFFSTLEISCNPIDKISDPLYQRLIELAPAERAQIIGPPQESQNYLRFWTHNCAELSQIAFTILLLLASPANLDARTEFSFCGGTDFDHAFVLISTERENIVVDPFFGFFGHFELYSRIVKISLSSGQGLAFGSVGNMLKTIVLNPMKGESSGSSDPSAFHWTRLVSFSRNDIIVLQRSPIANILSSTKGIVGGRNSLAFIMQYLSNIINLLLDKQALSPKSSSSEEYFVNHRERIFMRLLAEPHNTNPAKFSLTEIKQPRSEYETDYEEWLKLFQKHGDLETRIMSGAFNPSEIQLQAVLPSDLGFADDDDDFLPPHLRFKRAQPPSSHQSSAVIAPAVGGATTAGAASSSTAGATASRRQTRTHTRPMQRSHSVEPFHPNIYPFFNSEIGNIRLEGEIHPRYLMILPPAASLSWHLLLQKIRPFWQEGKIIPRFFIPSASNPNERMYIFSNLLISSETITPLIADLRANGERRPIFIGFNLNDFKKLELEKISEFKKILHILFKGHRWLEVSYYLISI